MASIQGTSIQVLASALASAFVHSSWAADCLIDSAVDLLGKRRPWIGQCVDRIMAEFARRPRRRALAEFIAKDSGFRKAFHKYNLKPQGWPPAACQFSPSPFAQSLNIHKLSTVDQLAEWMGVQIRELEWFADLRGMCSKAYQPRLAHYHYRILQKGLGAVRLIEAPKPRLKALQRQILDGILVYVPTHPAAQGFLRGGSIQTFAAPHVNQRLVIKMDLQEFFPSISSARVNAIFRSLGYPECIADLLAGVCTNAVPTAVWDDPAIPRESLLQCSKIQNYIQRYGCRHLPQGAPTSPVLSNLSAFQLDCRLSALANSAGASYTRYADDLAFSGGDDFRRSAKPFYYLASSIALEEGYQVNFRKTRFMTQSVQQKVVGLVVNSHVNVSRESYDQLKAILTNCKRFGPESQNRSGHANFFQHLQGRISYFSMISPTRGEKLRALLEQVKWQ